MHERIAAMSINGLEVQRLSLVIGGEAFPDETAARAWLEEGGYPVTAAKSVIHRAEGKSDIHVLEIVNDMDKFQEGSIVQIDTDPESGLSVMVGKLADGVNREELAVGKIIDVEVESKKDDDPATKTKTVDTIQDESKLPDPAWQPKDPTQGNLYNPAGQNITLDPALDDSKKADNASDNAGDVTGGQEGVTKEHDSAQDEDGSKKDTVPEIDEAAKADAIADASRLTHASVPVVESEARAKACLAGGFGGQAASDTIRRALYEALGEKPVERSQYKINLDIANKVYDAAEMVAKDKLAKDHRVKFDEFMAHFSESTTLQGVMNDANDGIPPGFGEAALGMVVAMRNNIESGNMDGVKKVASEFGQLVVSLATAFGMGEGTEKAQRMIDLFSQSLPQETEVETGESGQEDPAKKVGGQENESQQDPILAAIHSLTDKIKESETKVLSTISEVSDRVGKVENLIDGDEGLIKRVDQLEQLRQHRKSADDDGTPRSVKADKDATKEVNELAFRGAMGLSQKPSDSWGS